MTHFPTMKKFLATTGLLMTFAHTGQVFGQTVDYDALAELFGEPVTTSATGKPQRQSEAPASMIIITGDELRRSGARTIPDILQNYAGMDVNRYGTDQYSVTIRGGNVPMTPRLLVLVNGRQVYLDHHGYTDWSLIGVEFGEIQQIEVVRGPNSALFGFNAVAGVVNIVTKSPLAQSYVMTTTAEAGTHNRYELSFTGMTKLKDFAGLKLSAGIEEMDEWADITVGAGTTTRKNISGELAAQVADNIYSSISYTYASSQNGSQNLSYTNAHLATDATGLNGKVSVETRLGLINAQAFYNKFTQAYNGAILYFEYQTDVWSAKLEDLFKIGPRNSFRLGVEYRRNELDFPLQDDVGTVFYDIYAGSGMWEWQTSDDLTLTTAVRLDRMELGHSPIADVRYPRSVSDFDKNHTETSYNMSLAYRVDDITHIRFTAARGVQLPSLLALGTAIDVPSLQIYAVGNPSLEPSQTTSYELAFNRDVPIIDGSINLTLSTASVTDFIMSGYNNVIDFSATRADLLVLTDEKLGNFKSHAIELAMQGNALNKTLSWMVNYTWSDIDEDLVTPILNELVTLEEGTPRHKINVKLDYNDEAWQAYIMARYRSKTAHRASIVSDEVVDNIDLSGNITVDARVSYKLGNGLSVWASGENLTGNHAAGLSIFKAERRFLVGIGFSY